MSLPHERDRFYSIYETRARIDDQQALDDLLAPIPDAHVLRSMLASGNFTAQHFDPKQKSDFWVVSNGRTVLRLWLEGLNAQQAEQVRGKFKKLQRRGDGSVGIGQLFWLCEILREVVAAETLH